MAQKILSVIEEDGKKTKIFNDLKFDLKKKKHVIPVSKIFEAFHTRNEKLINRIMEANISKDQGFMKMIKNSVKFSNKINKKFPKYIVSVILFGSWARGEAKKTSDYDLAVVVDDTDLKEMTRVEAKKRLFGIVNATARKMNKKFTIQAYLLTEFWDYLKKSNPVIFTLLRDGVPIYDKGLFVPWKLLLKMGKVKPSPEAIESFINSARLLGKQIESKLEEIVTENIYYLMLNPAQALLMLADISPGTYSETPELLKRHFVSKKIMPKKYQKWLKDIVDLRKKVEHEKAEVTGKDLDKHWKRAKDYLAYMEELFEKLKKKKIKKQVKQLDKAFRKTVKNTLREIGRKGTEKDAYKDFRNHLVKKGLVPKTYLEFTNYLTSLKKASEKGRTVTDGEISKAKEEAADLFNIMNRLVETRRIKPGKPVKFLYNKKQGELWLLGGKIFIIPDLKHPEKKIFQAKLKKNGSFSKPKKTELDKLNKARKKFKGETVLMEKTLENISDFMGKEIKIVL